MADDVSAQRLGGFTRPLWNGIEVIRRLIHAFYDPSLVSTNSSSGIRSSARPDRCLVGDVVEKDMSGFLEALAQMTPVPQPVTDTSPEIKV
ncbi:MAG: hypothetical protein R3C56_34310 [Pirellulaceae bacterium]